MKHFFFCFAFLCGVMCTQAQKDTLTNTITIEVPTTIEKSSVLTKIEIPIVAKSDIIIEPIVDIKAEYWNTTVYNPYKDFVAEYPLQITFTDSTYSSPVLKEKVVTSRFGWRRGRPHKGIDIDLETGDKVVSVLDGIVRFARYSRGHGKTVVVRHFNGLETTYAHLSHISVKANDTISKGQLLGKGGNTGNSRGSHLHLSVTYKGEFIHPEYVFDFSNEANTIRAKELWVTRKWTRAINHSSRKLTKLNVFTTKETALASLKTKKKMYVVRKGDTLYGISRRNNISVASICKTNAIKKTSPLKIGQKLLLEL